MLLLLLLMLLENAKEGLCHSARGPNDVTAAFPSRGIERNHRCVVLLIRWHFFRAGRIGDDRVRDAQAAVLRSSQICVHSLNAVWNEMAVSIASLSMAVFLQKLAVNI
jgi:hypothetical protein